MSNTPIQFLWVLGQVRVVLDSSFAIIRLTIFIPFSFSVNRLFFLMFQPNSVFGR